MRKVCARHRLASTLDRDHDLPKLLAAFQVFVSRPEFGKRKGSVDHGLQSPTADQLHDLVELAEGSHDRTVQTQVAEEQMSQVDAHVRTGRGATGDEAAVVGKASCGLLPGGRADVFDDDINPLLGGDAADLVLDGLAGSGR